MNVPRLRMFAGPNGSGKSTIKKVIPENLLGVYINPDDIEKEINLKGIFDFSSYELTIEHSSEMATFFKNHPLKQKANLNDNSFDFEICLPSQIRFKNKVSSYHSSILCDFLRNKLLEAQKTFTFETVMSSKDKVEFLSKAQKLGFKTYLYYVATESPSINLLRINHRVTTGGHDVPQAKVMDRYFKSLDLLLDAIKNSNRAFLFDNSGETKTWIAEITNGNEIEFQTDEIPIWVKKYVVDKLSFHL